MREFVMNVVVRRVLIERVTRNEDSSMQHKRVFVHDVAILDVAQLRVIGVDNHADGRGAAACQAFNKLDAVVSIRANSNGIVHSIAIRRALDFKARTQIFHQLETASHRATECAADANVSFASRLLAKHWIKGDQLKNIDGLQAQLLSDPWYGLVADESEVFLPQM